MKNIGFIGDITYCRTVRDRYDGYLLGLKSADIHPDENIIAAKSAPERYYLKYEVEEALKGFLYMPEAVVCANDDIAMHLIKCLNDKEIRVPEDVAVTGYDNLESIVGHLPPFLSTVNVKHGELGKRLARQLLWRMENPKAPKEIVMLRHGVIIRGSSAKLPGFGAGGKRGM
jgi:LacI family transcriptional regulator